MVDALMIDFKLQCMGWSKAKIIEITKDSNFNVQFQHSSDYYNRIIERGSFDIAPYNSKSHDFEWRLSVQIGDVIDACDPQMVWYKSTILKKRTKEGTEDVIEVLIGYRTYVLDGEKVDEQGQQFNGWSEKYDEWIELFSPRIRRRNTKIIGSERIALRREDVILDDHEDAKNASEGMEFTILRQFYCESTFFIELSNEFGNNGGFELFYIRIADQVNWCPIKVMAKLVNIFA